MRNLALAALPALALMGCSGGEEATEPEAAGLEAGEWQMAFYVNDVSGENVTEEMRTEIATELDRELAMDPVCISEERAATPDAALFIPGEVNSECNFTESSAENGTIEMAGTCGEGANDGGAISINGTYEAASMEAVMTATIRDGGEEFSFAAVISGERTGECNG